MRYRESKSSGLSFFVALVICVMAGMTAALAYKTSEAREPAQRVWVPAAEK